MDAALVVEHDAAEGEEDVDDARHDERHDERALEAGGVLHAALRWRGERKRT